jgi:hypothetical protein
VGGSVDHRQIRLQFTCAARQRRPIHPARQVNIRQQNVDRGARDAQESIDRIGHAVDGKALLQKRFRDPLADEELIFDEQDAYPPSVRHIYASYVHGSHPPSP